MVVEETEVSSITQSRYAVGATTHEILSLITPSLKSRNVRLAQLHLRVTAALLAMRTVHPTYEVGGIVKASGWPTSDPSCWNDVRSESAPRPPPMFGGGEHIPENPSQSTKGMRPLEMCLEATVICATCVCSPEALPGSVIPYP